MLILILREPFGIAILYMSESGGMCAVVMILDTNHQNHDIAWIGKNSEKRRYRFHTLVTASSNGDQVTYVTHPARWPQSDRTLPAYAMSRSRLTGRAQLQILF